MARRRRIVGFYTDEDKRVRPITSRSSRRVLVTVRKASPAQRAAARRNIEKARRAWMEMSPEERARAMPDDRRATLVRGKVVHVPPDEYMYLGRTVRDRPPKGYSHVSEVKGTADRILYDYRHGVIMRKTANARLMRLVAIVEQSKLGELKLKKNKILAKQIINSRRAKLGFEPVSLAVTPGRPTKAQIEAAKRNIIIAGKVWRKLPSSVRKRKMPSRKGRPGYVRKAIKVRRNGKVITTHVWVREGVK